MTLVGLICFLSAKMPPSNFLNR